MAQKKKGSQGSARERLRQEQQQQAARDQRMKVVFRSLVGVAVLVVVAVVAAIVLNQGGTTSATPTTVTDDGGIVLEPGTDAADDGAAEDSADDAATTSAPSGEVPQVAVYVDFQCPHCLAFEQANLGLLTDQLSAGNISLAIHPVALMDNASQGTEFSSRAANAAACVAEHEPGVFLDVTRGLFDLQGPAAQGAVNDEVLTGAVKDAGASSSQVQACIEDRAYDGWVRDSTEQAVSDPALAGPSGRFGTPTVLVDGARFTGDPEVPGDLEAFIEQQR